MFMFGCSAKKYTVDYCGHKNLFKKARSSYVAGTQVKIYYPNPIYDTDYAFYLDGERLSVACDNKNGYVIAFTMPRHDVKLRVETRSFVPQVGYPGYSAVKQYNVSDTGKDSAVREGVNGFCEECGKALPQGAKFCPECGRKIGK